MMRRCVVLFLPIHLFEQIQILDAFILSCNASLQTVRRVTKCPSNISAYEEAEEKKNCSSLAPDAQTCQTFQYHCVLSDDLNYAIEVCAPSMYIVGYVCTKFSTIHKSIMRIDGFACNDSFTACPFGYNSTESFKYLLCYANVNKLLPTELPPRREISETVEPWLIVLVIPIILGISCLIFCRYSFVRKRRTFRRRQGMAQPNFSREVFELENRVQTPNSTGPGQVLLRENQDDIDGDYDSREARRLLKDRHNQLNEEPGPTVVSDPPPDVKPKKVAAPSPSVPIAEPPLDDPKDVPPPQATPVDYQSPESFLKSTNVQIQDPNLMSALRSVFNDTTTHPLFPTGLYTVLLIDVSTSINKAMFKEMQHFIDQMVDEVETSACDHNLEEMMAILTFGGRCEVILHFTNDYMPIKDALNEKVKLGGKTPMLFGLAMAVAYCLKFGKRVKVNGHIVNQRILMITDGYPTDSHDKDACHGTDYETNGIKVQSEVIKFLPILERSPITVSCIGVGECNQVFLKDIAERGHGHFYSMSNTQNSLKLGRYYLYQDPVTRARTAISQDNGRSDPKTIALQHTTATHLTDTDRAEILHLLKIDNDSRNPFPAPPPPKKELPKPNIKQEPDPLPTPTPVQPPPPVSEKPEIKDPPPNIPPPRVTVPPLKTDPPNGPSEGDVVPSSPDVSLSESDGELFESYGSPHNRCFPWGTRVIRGENWKWPDDQNMPGTVVAHKSEGVVVVKWDCGSHGEYPQENLFRINDPRALKPGEVIDVGCLVKRGPNWNRGDEDGGPETTGTVIRKHRNNKVSVIWPIGIVDRYSYGEGNKELELVVSGSAAAAPPSFVGGFGGMDPIEPDSREPMDGEEVVWQWIDCETNEFHTFSKDEKDKLEDIYKKKTGTVLVGYKGQQLRCQPAQWKYRDYTVKSRTGKLHRRVCTHDEAQTFYLIEAL